MEHNTSLLDLTSESLKSALHLLQVIVLLLLFFNLCKRRYTKVETSQITETCCGWEGLTREPSGTLGASPSFPSVSSARILSTSPWLAIQSYSFSYQSSLKKRGNLWAPELPPQALPHLQDLPWCPPASLRLFQPWMTIVSMWIEGAGLCYEVSPSSFHVTFPSLSSGSREASPNDINLLSATLIWKEY